jgi:hypothetical protein
MVTRQAPCSVRKMTGTAKERVPPAPQVSHDGFPVAMAPGIFPSKARHPPGVQSTRRLISSSMRAFGRDGSSSSPESTEILHPHKEDHESSPHSQCQALRTGERPSRRLTFLRQRRRYLGALAVASRVFKNKACRSFRTPGSPLASPVVILSRKLRRSSNDFLALESAV